MGQSILGLGMANDALRQIRKGDCIRVTRERIQVFVRWSEVRGERTGGVFISVMGLTSDSVGMRLDDVTREGRLGPGWNPAQFKRLVTAMIHINGRTATIEALYGDMEVAHLTDAQMAEIDQLERATGHTSVYKDMTLDDVEFWRDWLDRQLVPALPETEES